MAFETPPSRRQGCHLHRAAAGRLRGVRRGRSVGVDGPGGPRPAAAAGPLPPGPGRALPRMAAKQPCPWERTDIKQRFRTQTTSDRVVKAADEDGRCPTGVIAPGFAGEWGGSTPWLGAGRG